MSSLSYPFRGELLLGLIVPSATSWMEGAEALEAAPLSLGAFNLIPESGPKVRAGEVELHALARRARSSISPAERANTYAQMLTLCASCHGLHPNIWGPGTGR